MTDSHDADRPPTGPSGVNPPDSPSSGKVASPSKDMKGEVALDKAILPNPDTDPPQASHRYPTKNIILVIIFLVGLALTIYGHIALSASTKPKPIPLHPQRIVTLAPSVTETVFAVGLGPEVVGVTKFCHYPPEVNALPKVGGFSDINVEAILKLRPDLAILPVDKVENQNELKRLGISVMAMDTRTISGLMDALTDLGKSTDHVKEAQEVKDRISLAIARAAERAKGKPKPKVMFSVMHSYAGLGYISELTIAGRDGFFDHLIEICGGVNAYEGRLSFPTVSREAIFRMNPDVIIDLMRSYSEAEDSIGGWMQLKSVSAVDHNRVYMFTKESDTVPGPRAWQTIDKVSMVIQPDTSNMPPNILGDVE